MNWDWNAAINGLLIFGIIMFVCWSMTRTAKQIGKGVSKLAGDGDEEKGKKTLTNIALSWLTKKK